MSNNSNIITEVPPFVESFFTEKGYSNKDLQQFMKEYNELDVAEQSLFIYELVGKKLYKTYPVDIKTFIHDPDYLGTIYSDIIFKIWEDLLQEIYPAPLCKKYNEVLLSCGTRCFAKGTQIRMYNGSLKNVEDIKEGELVMGPDSLPRKVSNTTHGKEEMFKITPRRGGNPFVCNKHHILTLRKIRNHNGAPNFYENMSVEDFLNKSEHQRKKNYRIYHSDAIEYSEKQYLIDPYIMGCHIGDGHTNAMRITTINTEILEAWKNIPLPEGYKCRVTELPNRKTKTYDVAISKEKRDRKESIFLNEIRRLYSTGHKRIPQEYLIGSIQQRRELLAGILDTDGYKDKRSRPCYRTITTKYADLAEDYATLARSLGIRATVHERNKKLSYVDKIYTSYDVNLTGDFTVIPCKLKRKQTESIKPVREHLISEFTIESIGEGEFYGFEVDKDHLFLLEDYTVVHNSGKSTIIIISALYEIYLLTCMINPTAALALKNSASIVFALLSKDNATATSQLGSDIHKGLTASPYFNYVINNKLSFSRLDGEGVKITDDILIKAGSSLATITGTDLYFGCLDEANMPSPKIAAEDLVKVRMQMYRTMIDRRNATYDKAPKMSGMIMLTSSPMDTDDVIGARIDEVYVDDIKNVLIRDNIPRWEARGETCKEKFDFFLGSNTQDPCILELSDLDRTKVDPELIIQIPRTTEYWNYFKGSNVRTAIQEVAGRRTVAENSLFTSVSVFSEVFNKENDIFKKDELNINIDNMNEFTDYMFDKDYFKHPKKPECYRYIHLDIASKRDRFGMSSVYSDRVTYTSETGEQISRRKYYIDFCLGISSAGGQAVDILKVLEFIYTLKKNGYPIKLVTTDNHQGELARQILRRHGVETEYLSVEKTTEPYYHLKNLILTKTLEGYKNDLLMKELRGLRVYKKNTKEKIEKGKGYTDDLSDSLAGATYSCSQDLYYKKTDDIIDDLIGYSRELNDTLLEYNQFDYNRNASSLNKKKRLGFGY